MPAVYRNFTTTSSLIAVPSAVSSLLGVAPKKDKPHDTTTFDD
jgi:hypothetical protein